MIVAYLVNQYPSVTHTFIREEIHGVEQAGLEVLRFSIRRSEAPLVDPVDIEEAARTTVLLEEGAGAVFRQLVSFAARKPRSLVRALGLAIAIGWRSDRGLARHLAYLGEAVLLIRNCNRLGIDRVHAHFGSNPAAVAMLCRTLGGPPYSVTYHGPRELERERTSTLREKVSRASFIVAVSHYGKHLLEQQLTEDLVSRVHLVACGAGERFFTTRPRPAPTRPRIVCVARLSEEKGHSILISAAALLAKEGVELELTLVGDGPLRATLAAQIRRSGLEHRIEISGAKPAEEVIRNLLGARALVCPSLKENLPIALMEALALGRPVVASEVGGIPELVVNRRTGWLVQPGSVEELAQALREVLALPCESLEAMGRRGAETVASRHRALHQARHLAKLFTDPVAA